jgi:hypothetical protein
MFLITYYVKIWQNFAPKNNTAFMFKFHHKIIRTLKTTLFGALLWLKGLKSCIEPYP